MLDLITMILTKAVIVLESYWNPGRPQSHKCRQKCLSSQKNLIAFFWTKIFSVVSIFFIQLWFYSTVFWLFYHSNFFNCFIFKLIHPLNIACLAGCLFLFFLFFGVFFLLWFIKRSDSATQKLNWEQQRKRWGRGQGERAGRKTTCSQRLEIFKCPIQSCERRSLAYAWYDVSWSQTSASKLLRQRFVVLWLCIIFLVVVYQSSLLTI